MLIYSLFHVHHSYVLVVFNPHFLTEQLFHRCHLGFVLLLLGFDGHELLVQRLHKSK